MCREDRKKKLGDADLDNDDDNHDDETKKMRKEMNGYMHDDLKLFDELVGFETL